MCHEQGRTLANSVFELNPFAKDPCSVMLKIVSGLLLLLNGIEYINETSQMA